MVTRSGDRGTGDLVLELLRNAEKERHQHGEKLTQIQVTQQDHSTRLNHLELSLRALQKPVHEGELFDAAQKGQAIQDELRDAKVASRISVWGLAATWVLAGLALVSYWARNGNGQ